MNALKTSLEDDESLRGRSDLPFDQFAGKSTTYNDDIYSTKIDKSKVTRETQERANKIEKEIEGTKSINRHVAEERN